jgi:pimeloyl-ACP methyl ester carboxylesterase
MYHPVMELLDRPVAAPDRLGFGFSDPPPDTPTIAHYAVTSLAAADALGWDRFDVIGTHTGSVEAIELARTAGDRVRRVGLVSIPTYTSEEVAVRLRGVAAPRPAPTLDGSHLVSMWSRRVAIRNGKADPDYLQELFIDELLSAYGAHLAYRAVLDYPTLDHLAELRHPLVVFAPHDDLHAQTQRARRALEQQSTWIDLPDLDFDLWAAAPGRLAALIDSHFPVEHRSTNG